MRYFFFCFFFLCYNPLWESLTKAVKINFLNDHHVFFGRFLYPDIAAQVKRRCPDKKYAREWYMVSEVGWKNNNNTNILKGTLNQKKKIYVYIYIYIYIYIYMFRQQP